MLDDHWPLLDKCAAEPPHTIELSALAAMLHAFYSGIENLFRRICVELGEDVPAEGGWHRQLLDVMTRPGPDRPAVITPEWSEILQGYLSFRHVFRQAYTLQLCWERMAPLACEAPATLARLESAPDEFLRVTETKG